MSRSIFLLLARCALLALLPGATLFAQIKPYQPNEVLLGVRGKLRVNGLYYMNAAAASSPGTRVLDVAPDNGPNKATTTDGANFAFSVKPGQLYSFQFSAGDYDWADIQFDVPAGYVLKIGRPYCPLSPRTTFRAQGSISYSVNLTLTPADGLFSLAAGYGTNPSLQPKVNWGISLGAMPDGNWAGAVRWWQREFDDALLSNSSLSYDGSVAQGIYTAAYADGSLKYIDADNVVVIIERGANRGYSIKFYTGDTWITGITADTDHVPNVNGATPFVTYEVSNPNPNGSTLDPAYGIDLKRTQPYLDDAGNPATKTDHWIIKRELRAGQYALVMSQADGARDVVVVATTPSSGQWTETTTVGTVSKVQRTFQTFPWGTEITSEVNDPQGAALTTTYDYHAGSYSYYNVGAVYWSPGSASVGKLKKITRPDGSWETYSYYEDSARYGQLKQILRPWDDAPSETSGTAQVMSYAYAAESIATNANVQIVPGLSFLSQLAGVETQVGATSVGRVYYATPTATVDPSNGFPVFDPLPISLSTAYSVWPSGDAPIVTRTQRAYSGASAYETTVTRTFASWANPDYAGKLYSQTNPDGTRTSASYHTGTYADYTESTTQWSQTGFAPGAGSARCDTFLTGASTNPGMGAVQFTTDTISTTAIDPVWMVPFKSLRTQTIYDVFARPVLNLTYVFVGGTSFQLIGWEKRAYNIDGTLASKQTHTGELWSGTYVAGRLRAETRPDGTITKYTYNALNQVTEREELGQPGETPIWPGQPALRTVYTVDLLGRVTQTAVLASNNQPGRVSSASYNLAGQLVSETAEDGLSTTYAYTNAGRTVTATLPGGATKVVSRLRDGSTASVTGTAIVAEHCSKSIGTGGSVIQQTNLATASSPRWVKSYRDWLGRSTREERPTTLAGITFNKISVYNTFGQLVRLEQTNLANTLYTYNALGELEFSGLDVNANGQLDLASMDRIQKSETTIVSAGGAWWTQTLNYVYNQDNSATPLQQSKQLTRLLPYAGGNYAGGIAFLQAHNYDLFGNATVATTTLNRPARLVTVTTDVPGSSVDDITWTRNGLLLKKQTAQNLTYSYTYDHFRRLIGEVDPRTGNAETAYYPNGNIGAAGKVQFKKDTAGNQTSYTYSAATGRLTAETNAQGKTRYFSYTARGEIGTQWGATTYPVAYDYSAYGERTAMATFRGGSDWGQPTWPATAGPADLTTWAYDPATGTLTSKTDAANKTVSYTYDARLQLKTRTWARNVTTTYSYSAVTGEQTGLDYSDSTPDLSYTHNRLGQTATVTDATGTRSFAYGATTMLPTSETLPSTFASRVLSRSYQTSGVVGRYQGYSLSGASGTGTDITSSYGYDSYGRLNAVSADGTTFNYAYTPNSTLLASIADTASGWTQTRTYLTNADNLDVLETKFSTATLAKFDYAYDSLLRRTELIQSGNMFNRYIGGGLVTKWTYDDRSEVTSAKSYHGTNPTDLSQPVGQRDYGFSFDNIGNRISSSVDSHATGYTSSPLNQIATRSPHGSVAVTGLAPAAATVSVNGSATGVARQGEYFSTAFCANNATAALWLSLTTASSYGGSNTRGVYLARTGQTYQYDFDGNLTSDEQWDYTWDAENRLVSIQTTAVAASLGAPNQRFVFTYDHQGRRVSKQAFTWSSGWVLQGERRFIYDGWNLIAEYTVSGSTLTLAGAYHWGLDVVGDLVRSGGVGALLQVWLFGQGAHAVVYDANGNLGGLVNPATGAFSALYEYGPFGETLRAEGPVAQSNPFRFSTKYTDNETGLVYYGLRYYSPSLGRFVNRDPSEEQGGLNLYAFCRNNGVNSWDRLGLDTKDVDGGTGVGWGIDQFTGSTALTGSGDRNDMGFMDVIIGSDGSFHTPTSSERAAMNAAFAAAVISNSLAAMQGAMQSVTAANLSTISSQLASSMRNLAMTPSTTPGSLRFVDYTFSDGQNYGSGRDSLYGAGVALAFAVSPELGGRAIGAAVQSNVDVSSYSFQLGAEGMMNLGSAAVIEAAPILSSLGSASRTLTISSEAASSTTPLYRAVSPAEAADLAATQTFRNPMGTEVKYFSTSAEGAASYARQTYGTGLYEGPYTIIRTDAPTTLVENPLLRASVDRGIPAVVVPTEQLPKLAPPTALPATPLPPKLPTIRAGGAGVGKRG
ncbi:MAG: RHS repeat-associated core domain-containing protein [Opitutae bacterium]|nr:RHS repeat-associated core domain-containing protein [Opitutae bacterium]